jgi:hypothetical protein
MPRAQPIARGAAKTKFRLTSASYAVPASSGASWCHFSMNVCVVPRADLQASSEAGSCHSDPASMLRRPHLGRSFGEERQDQRDHPLCLFWVHCDCGPVALLGLTVDLAGTLQSTRSKSGAPSTGLLSAGTIHATTPQQSLSSTMDFPVASNAPSTTTSG